MKWHDLFYFSKGERRALTLLLSLIAAAWLTLLWSERRPEETGPQAVLAPSPQPVPPTEIAGDTISSSLSSSQRGIVAAASSGYAAKGYPKRREYRPAEANRRGKEPSMRDQKTGKSYASSFRSAAAKFPAGTIVELNSADTSLLKKVPGIGSSFARRIVKYRNLLGGFHTVAQLGEVYGIDEERYRALAPWFRTDVSLIRPLQINRIPADSLPYHPYLNKPQRRVLRQLRQQKGRIESWDNLQLLEEFSDADRQRLAPYLSFE